MIVQRLNNRKGYLTAYGFKKGVRLFNRYITVEYRVNSG